MLPKQKSYLINYMENKEALDIFNTLLELYPDAHCELDFNNPFEMLIATVLSAQTTDVSVNKVTPILFTKYPTSFALSKANESDVEEIIKPVGLAKTKARNIINLSKILVEKYNGDVIKDFDELIKLPGVGRKTANVVLAEAFDIPRIGVDTHVSRVSYRLGLTTNTDPFLIEQDLMALFPSTIWKEVHLKLLFFGRYLCKKKNPECTRCPFIGKCKKL